MKNIFLFVCLLISVLTYGQNQKTINDFKKFVDTVELKQTSYTDDGWKIVSIKYDNYTKELSTVENKLTTQQKDQITEIKSKYYGIKTKTYTRPAMKATKTFVKTLFH